MAANNMNTVTSNAVFDGISFRRTFDNTALGWNEIEIKQGIENIIQFYMAHRDLLLKELSGKTAIIHDIHNQGGSGCLLLTDNGQPYFEGLYYTYYQPYIYQVHSGPGGLQMWRYTGELIY